MENDINMTSRKELCMKVIVKALGRINYVIENNLENEFDLSKDWKILNCAVKLLRKGVLSDI